MKKSDLKDGMMLKLRDDNMYSMLHGYLLELSLDDTYKIIASMDDYDDEFNNLATILSNPSIMDVMKIYDKDMNVLWEREEVDWSEVKVGTKVLMSDSKINWFNGIFLKKTDFIDDGVRFKVANNSGLVEEWKYCKLVEEQKEEVTTDDIKEEMATYCHGNSDNCNYLCGICATKYILNNYNVTRK